MHQRLSDGEPKTWAVRVRRAADAGRAATDRQLFLEAKLVGKRGAGRMGGPFDGWCPPPPSCLGGPLSMLLSVLVRVALLNRFEERPRLAPPLVSSARRTRTRRSSSREHGRTARRDWSAILYRILARRFSSRWASNVLGVSCPPPVTAGAHAGRGKHRALVGLARRPFAGEAEIAFSMAARWWIKLNRWYHRV